MNPLKQIICLSLLFLAACHTQPQGGATATKSKYDWSTYKYANGAYNKLTKYCSKSDYGNGYTDSRTTLERSDDAAYQNWGSDWCMPTQA